MKDNGDESECQNKKTEGQEQTTLEKIETLSLFKEIISKHDHLHSKFQAKVLSIIFTF